MAPTRPQLLPPGFRRFGRKAIATSVAVAAAIGLGGCQAYQPAPLDLPAHHAVWAARDPASPAVADYARRLASAPEGRLPGTGPATVAGAVAAAPFDATDGLSLPEAEAVALFFNPQLRAARLKARVPAAGAAEAGRWDDPTIRVDAERIVEAVQHPWVIGGMLNLTLPLSGRLPLEREKADADAEAARANALVEERRVLTELGSAWAELAVVEQRTALTRAFTTDLEALVGQADKLRAAGELAPLEAGLFRVELARRRAELASLGPLRREHEVAVKALLGLVPDAPVRLLPTLATDARFAVNRSDQIRDRQGATESTVVIPGGPAISTPSLPYGRGSDQDALRHRLEANHPKLIAAMADYASAERALALEVRKQYPDLQVGGGFGEDEGTHRILGGLTVPVPLFNANRRAIAEARAQRDAARAAAEATYEGLVAALARAEAAAAGARIRREAIEREVAPLADEQVRAARALGRLGDASAIVVFEALTRAQDVRLELLDAAAREAAARVQLDALLRPVVAEGPDTAGGPSAKEKR